MSDCQRILHRNVTVDSLQPVYQSRSASGAVMPGTDFSHFLVINFCFLIFWLIVRYRFALVPLLGFLLCYPQLRTYMPVNPGTAGQPENSIKLLSYNIMSFGNMKKENGQNPILNYIKTATPTSSACRSMPAPKPPRYISAIKRSGRH